jgi:hypothetical protein
VRRTPPSLYKARGYEQVSQLGESIDYSGAESFSEAFAVEHVRPLVLRHNNGVDAFLRTVRQTASIPHSSIQTTGDVYADWDIEQLTETMAEVLAADA